MWNVRVSELLNPPDWIANGYIVVAGAGVVVVGCAVAEKYLVIFDHSRAAERVADCIEKILPWAFMGGCAWAFFNNPWI